MRVNIVVRGTLKYGGVAEGGVGGVGLITLTEKENPSYALPVPVSIFNLTFIK